MGFKQPVAIIPNGIDVPPLKIKIIGNKRTLLFLGRIHPVKGLDMLLPAWAAVHARFPDWQLRIVGSDAGFHARSGYLAEMQNLSISLGLRNVEFTGALHGAEKWQAYLDADLFVLPTYSENFGMSVAEALAAGTPVIVTQGAPWSGLAHEKAGEWIEIGIDSLVAALEDLLSRTSDELSTMGQLGRAWMEREYSWDSIGRHMADVYDWVLGRTSCMPSCIKIN